MSAVHTSPLSWQGELAVQRDRIHQQKGFANLLKGISGMYRNPTAHDPRARGTVTDAELLELLTTLSMVHRRLDSATRLR